VRLRGDAQSEQSGRRYMMAIDRVHLALKSVVLCMTGVLCRGPLVFSW